MDPEKERNSSDSACHPSALCEESSRGSSASMLRRVSLCEASVRPNEKKIRQIAIIELMMSLPFLKV